MFHSSFAASYDDRRLGPIGDTFLNCIDHGPKTGTDDDHFWAPSHRVHRSRSYAGYTPYSLQQLSPVVEDRRPQRPKHRTIDLGQLGATLGLDMETWPDMDSECADDCLIGTRIHWASCEGDDFHLAGVDKDANIEGERTLGSTTVAFSDDCAEEDPEAWPDTDSDHCYDFCSQAGSFTAQSSRSARSSRSRWWTCDFSDSETESQQETLTSNPSVPLINVIACSALESLACSFGMDSSTAYNHDPTIAPSLPFLQRGRYVDMLHNKDARDQCSASMHTDAVPSLLSVPTPTRSGEIRSMAFAAVLANSVVPPWCAPGHSASAASEAASAGSGNQTLAKPSASEEVTTLMIRKLPSALEQGALIEEINRSGFAGLYDFCYLPRCFNTGLGKGYGFVNLASPTIAASLQGAWHKLPRFGVAPTVAPAEIQGFEANVRRWAGPRLRRVKDPKNHPFIVDNCLKATEGDRSSSDVSVIEARAAPVKQALVQPEEVHACNSFCSSRILPSQNHREEVSQRAWPAGGKALRAAAPKAAHRTHRSKRISKALQNIGTEIKLAQLI